MVGDGLFMLRKYLKKGKMVQILLFLLIVIPIFIVFPRFNLVAQNDSTGAIDTVNENIPFLNRYSDFITFDGNSIYFINNVNSFIPFLNFKKGLYKIDTKTNMITKIWDMCPICIKNDENYIYCILNDQYNYGIYKIKKSDNSISKISDESAWELSIFGNYIYYTKFVAHERLSKGSNNGEIFKMKIDGTQNIKLTNNFDGTDPRVGNSFDIYNGYLYYVSGFIDYDIGSKIGKINLATDINTFQNNSSVKATYFRIDNGWIYYLIGKDVSTWISSASNNDLYRIRVDGTDKQKLLENIESFNVLNNILYYVPYDKNVINPCIIKCNVDGSDKSVLNVSVRGISGGLYSGIWLNGNKVYFIGRKYGDTKSHMQLCSVSNNGSDFKEYHIN